MRRRFFRKATDNKASNQQNDQQNDSFQKILDDYILYQGNIENIDHTENDDNMLYFDSILQDPCAFSLQLTLDFLKHITKDFSEERVLGSGGFGVVYKGVLGNGKAVAVKRLRNVETNLSDEQYKKELRNIIGLQNKNIVQFKGYCADSSQVPWPVSQGQGRDQYVLAEIRERVLCFEYLPNKSLRQHISDPSCGLEWLVRYDIIKGICSGLHYLHTECDIAHMDLKPENILLDDNMVPKIGDFGTSRLFDENQSRIITSNCVGSLGYMSPEYLHRRMISKKADIFSFGVIILELLTGSKSDYPEREELFTQFTEDVVRKWRNRLPDADYSRQVRTCISIALNCVDTNRDRRPTTGDILKKLDEVQSRSPLQDLISSWSWGQKWMQKWVQKWMQKLVQVQKFGKIAIGVGAVVLMLLNPSCSWSWVVTALNSITLVVTLFAVGFPAVVVGLYMMNKFRSRPRDILFTIAGTIVPAVVVLLKNHPRSILFTTGLWTIIALKLVTMAGVTLFAIGVVVLHVFYQQHVLDILTVLFFGLVAVTEAAAHLLAESSNHLPMDSPEQEEQDREKVATIARSVDSLLDGRYFIDWPSVSTVEFILGVRQLASDLHIICCVNEDVCGPEYSEEVDPLSCAPCKYRYSHVNFTVTNRDSKSETLFPELFFAEFDNEGKDSSPVILCKVNWPIFSEQFRCLYCESEGARVVHPPGLKFHGRGSELEEVILLTNDRHISRSDYHFQNLYLLPEGFFVRQYQQIRFVNDCTKKI